MITIQENILLAPFTTFHIGGPARYFVSVSSDADAKEALQYAKENHLAVFVLGGGSNVLFSDAGFCGLVIKLENANIEVSGTDIMAGAGALLGDVVAFAGKHALEGMELLSGIPGTLGGAVRGNAGAFGVEIGSLVTSVTFLNTKTLELQSVARDECGFSYRQSMFKKRSDLIVLSATLSLRNGDQEAIERIGRETVAKREAKHPQRLACAGSFFMNPTVKNKNLLGEFLSDTGVESREGVLPAGWIIDYAGLRGKRVGGAQISEIHPNYLLNTGDATAEDVLILASIVKQRVRTQFGIRLREEVQMVGF